MRPRSSLKRYRYTGKERDIENGFYYHGARYRAPWLGRWVSPDPAGLVDGPSLYAYCLGNPVTLTDPSGASSDDGVDAYCRNWAEQGMVGYGCEPQSPPVGTPKSPPVAPHKAIPARKPPPAGAAKPTTPAAAPPATPPTQPPPAAPAVAQPGAPAAPQFEPQVSDPEALRQAEGMGHIEGGDIVQFGKGLVMGATFGKGPNWDIDPHYSGAAEVGRQLGQNLVLELTGAAVGRGLQLAAKYGRAALQAPMWWFMGAGGVGSGSLKTLRALEEAAALRQALAAEKSLAAGAIKSVRVIGHNMPNLEYGWARYQVFAGSRLETAFEITRAGAAKTQVFLADTVAEGYFVEAKLGLRGEEGLAHLYRQASSYLELNEFLGLKGVRYAVAHLGDVDELEGLFRAAFPEAMASGTLRVLWVPW